MKKKNKPERLRPYLITLASICVLAFILRVVPPFQNVFGNGFVSFLETDAYNRMYYAVKLAGMPFLQGLLYMANNNLLFSWIIATLGHVFPIELAGAWLPPVLAVMTVAVVYGIGSLVFNRIVGLMGALFVSVIPSEFLHRSLLGFTDHHILEVLLMALTVYCLLKSLRHDNEGYKPSGRYQTGCVLSATSCRFPILWAIVGRAFLLFYPPAWKHETTYRFFNRWTVLAGLSLFLYLANWKGGFFMLGVLGIFAGIVLVHDLVSRKGIAGTVRIAMPLIIALALYLPLGGWTAYFFWLPTFSTNAAIPAASNASAVQAAATAGEMASTVFSPVSERTISEIMPLLAPGGTFNPAVVITNLHLFVFPFLISLYLLWRWRRDRAKLFLLVWTLAVLAATLNERRFLYYLTLNIGLLSAVVVYEAAIRLRGQAVINIILLSMPFVIISMPAAVRVGSGGSYQMSPEWHSALTWLKEQPDTGHVTAWSDFGHWIKYVSKKEPNLLPGPGGKDVAKLYLSSNENETIELLKKLNTAYLIVDVGTFKYKGVALAIVAGLDIKDYKDTLSYFLLSGGGLPFLEPVYQSESILIYRTVSDL